MNENEDVVSMNDSLNMLVAGTNNNARRAVDIGSISNNGSRLNLNNINELSAPQHDQIQSSSRGFGSNGGGQINSSSLLRSSAVRQE